jgi:serine/threonine protein kinase
MDLSANRNVSVLSQYKILKLLGKGNYGTVYLIESITTKKLYALKMIFINDEQQLKSTNNEIDILRNIKSQYITQIIDFFQDEVYIYITMEYATKGDLLNYIKNQKEIDYNFCNKVIYQVTCGLRDLHLNNVIHRDIKPSNILIFENDNIKIADFGVSKYTDKFTNNAYTTIGTPFYMSPEMINGYAYTYSADYWSFGCTLYELISGGNRPFEATSFFDLMMKIQKGKINLSKINDKYQLLIKKLIIIEPSQRYDYKKIFSFYIKKIYNPNKTVLNSPRLKLENNNLINKKLPVFNLKKQELDIILDDISDLDTTK